MTPLRQRMLHDMLQIRNLAENTQKSYLLQVSSFARHFGRSPELLGPEEIRAWLVYLREGRKLAPSSLCPAIGALRFLYRITLNRPWSDEDFPLPKKPVRLPVVLSLEEITTFFESIASLKQRTILMTAYAAGLRVSEAVHLKVTDIDSTAHGHPCEPGQESQGPLRDALTASARDSETLLARDPSQGVAVPG
ncbi:phage integrase N-terminal SAM-like domain-containing protein [Burkholderia ambifaria]|uniref:Integrase domain protein SAM domain protein n=1 Tax=Burkholderia ambifaria MEX-5 TaxID=396597 RepID=B1T964_9BURK|nr:phage integrase N-terminal SAM-like domain-containing protein [Burkholderia ambifaria]EDT39881.1 integrase domain protein SAM domain protein [Burkholderia ambifaria MEX-5]